jgi:hypothetical protein
MQFDLYGMSFEAPGVTFYLWSPWRCSALEHKLFESIKVLPNVEFEKEADELQLHMTDPKQYANGIKMCERVLKGWQEEASDVGTNERRVWRWMIEGDADPHGYDHNGEKTSVWAFLRLALERPADGPERAEDIDLNGFGLRYWRVDEAE